MNAYGTAEFEALTFGKIRNSPVAEKSADTSRNLDASKLTQRMIQHLNSLTIGAIERFIPFYITTSVRLS